MLFITDEQKDYTNNYILRNLKISWYHLHISLYDLIFSFFRFFIKFIEIYYLNHIQDEALHLYTYINYILKMTMS